ncbi:VOC family protein [Echinicola rosea]|uniref:Extradiol dioxygenase n=1 Tax=Echinicola rosea TaxID=1807691 RepID=A0ABQ1V429_9BACT|nr:VOC family protein [Echinicola rosea]GGF34331.1 extradiol dioxygenase [Echinicola rosea]
MPSKIFVNLPVKDLSQSRAFFEHLGFNFNPQFSDEKAACLVINEDNIYVMLLTEPFFRQFTKKEIADANKTTEVLIAIDMDSKAAVDEMVTKAIDAGGSTYSAPLDQGWMYQHSFADPDGHQWELCFMNETAIPND